MLVILNENYEPRRHLNQDSIVFEDSLAVNDRVYAISDIRTGIILDLKVALQISLSFQGIKNDG